MMNENLNLCEILKGHEDETFWSPLVGNVIYKSGTDELVFFQYGSSIIDIPYNGKDMNDNIAIFPSQHQQDWNKWIKEKKSKFKTWKDIEKSKDIIIEKISIYSNGENNDIWIPHCSSSIIRSARALIQINKLIEIGYGGNVTTEDWKNDEWKYCIVYYVKESKFNVEKCYNNKQIILFHTKEQAEDFLSYPENVQLLKDYFMI